MTDPIPDAAPATSPVTLYESSDGAISLQPATFLERWGTVFVAAGLLWMLAVTSGVLIYFVVHLPPLPSTAGMNSVDAHTTLTTHKEVYDQYRQSLTDVFDLLVTRTILPIVILLLGYLFGKTPNRS